MLDSYCGNAKMMWRSMHFNERLRLCSSSSTTKTQNMQLKQKAYLRHSIFILKWASQSQTKFILYRTFQQHEFKMPYTIKTSYSKQLWNSNKHYLCSSSCKSKQILSLILKKFSVSAILQFSGWLFQILVHRHWMLILCLLCMPRTRRPERPGRLEESL